MDPNHPVKGTASIQRPWASHQRWERRKLKINKRKEMRLPTENHRSTAMEIYAALKFSTVWHVKTMLTVIKVIHNAQVSKAQQSKWPFFFPPVSFLSHKKITNYVILINIFFISNSAADEEDNKELKNWTFSLQHSEVSANCQRDGQCEIDDSLCTICPFLNIIFVMNLSSKLQLFFSFMNCSAEAAAAFENRSTWTLRLDWEKSPASTHFFWKPKMILGTVERWFSSPAKGRQRPFPFSFSLFKLSKCGYNNYFK